MLSAGGDVVSGTAVVVGAPEVMSIGEVRGTTAVVTVIVVLKGSVVEMDVVSGRFVVEITVGRMVVGATSNKSKTHFLHVDRRKDRLMVIEKKSLTARCLQQLKSLNATVVSIIDQHVPVTVESDTLWKRQL